MRAVVQACRPRIQRVLSPLVAIEGDYDGSPDADQELDLLGGQAGGERWAYLCAETPKVLARGKTLVESKDWLLLRFHNLRGRKQSWVTHHPPVRIVAMSDKRFQTSLKRVAEELGVPSSAVIQWRDKDGCPFLITAPYDLEAIELWLTQRVRREIDPKSELDKRKIEAEVRKLERDGKLFSRDKLFWMAAAALGISISRDVREWIAESGNDEEEQDQTTEHAKSVRRQRPESAKKKLMTIDHEAGVDWGRDIYAIMRFCAPAREQVREELCRLACEVGLRSYDGPADDLEELRRSLLSTATQIAELYSIWMTREPTSDPGMSVVKAKVSDGDVLLLGIWLLGTPRQTISVTLKYFLELDEESIVAITGRSRESERQARIEAKGKIRECMRRLEAHSAGLRVPRPLFEALTNLQNPKEAKPMRMEAAIMQSSLEQLRHLVQWV